MTSELPSDFPLRGGLLPEGCKDLLDVIKPKERQGMDAITGILPWPLESLKKEAALGEIEKSIEADPPAPGTVIEIGPQITLRELAELVGRQWYEIIPTLIVLDTVVDGPDHVLSFELAGRIASGYGYEVWRVG